jgi:hypothetical protein
MSRMHWQYHVELFDTDGFRSNQFKKLDIDRINELGAEGWEMVSAVSLQDQSAGGFGVGSARTMRIALWFKRPLAE